jgi:hypothetical protein
MSAFDLFISATSLRRATSRRTEPKAFAVWWCALTQAPGTQLPSSRALATDLGVSRMTAVLAFEQLAVEDYVTARSGAGTFVNCELPDNSARIPSGSKHGAS